MRAFLSEHKRGLLISLLVLAAAVIAVLAAFFCTGRIKDHHAKEAVPPGRVHDAGVFGESIQVYDSTQGEIVIDDSGMEGGGPATIPATTRDSNRTSDP